MCVKPMEENEDDKVVNMIINYFSARVNIVEGPRAANRALFSFGYPFIVRIVLERTERSFGQKEET